MALALKNLAWSIPRALAGQATVQSEPDTRDTAGAIPLIDEDELVRDAQAGDSEAFERLYEIHVRRVYALCLRMLADPRRAEEMTQDVFVRAWQALATFQFQSAFGTWLHRIGVNVVLGDLRSEKRREGKVNPVPDLEVFVHEVRESMPETMIDLERAIAQLPDGAREVLVLHDIQGYRYREIAALIGTAEGTVKSQLHRARRLVREALIK